MVIGVMYGFVFGDYIRMFEMDYQDILVMMHERNDVDYQTDFVNMIKMRNIKWNLVESEMNTDNSSVDIPYIPAFTLIGPAKSGTRSVIEALSSISNGSVLEFRYRSERNEFHFWSGIVYNRCGYYFNNESWNRILDELYNSTENQFYLYNLSKLSLMNSKNKGCNLRRYYRYWDASIRDIFESKEYQCNLPFFRLKYANLSNKLFINVYD